MHLKLIAITSLLACGVAAAQSNEVGRVISSTPIVQQISVPHQQCTTQQVTVQPQKSGGGAVMGAIAGGAVGNAVGGHGAGNAASTMLGVIGGAILGDRIEGMPAPVTENVQSCTTVNTIESRVSGYNVVYEYAGKQYSMQMPTPPGPTIQVQVVPVGAAPQPSYSSGYDMNAIPSPVRTQSQPVYVQPSPPVYVQPAPPIVITGSRYYDPVPPVVFDLRYGYGYHGDHYYDGHHYRH